jgi:aldehyde dehydrogenase (NAD+)
MLAQLPPTDRQPLRGSDLSHIPARVAALRSAFESGRTRSYAWRMEQLGALLKMVQAEESAIVDALHKDVGKPALEAWSAEVSEVANGLKFVRKNLKKWMRIERVSTPLLALPGKSWIQREPLGVALIIAPWNYPFSLSINPLAGALAAGNAVLLKPSEVAPHTSALLARLLPQYLDREAVAVLEGGVPETTEVLAQRFDHIFYTGNGAVGRVVLQAAVKHLTPVTLELGGKSPCIIDEHADLEVAARRVTWAKFYNCGQTCVAPDYVLVHERAHDKFVALLKQTITSFWGERPETSKDYGRIVNERHHRRLMALLPNSGSLAAGGQGDEQQRYIAPTVLTDVRADAPIMQDEIFGPILPVLKVASIDEAISFVNARDKPLALYAFTADPAAQQRVVERTSSGGVVLNHAILHLIIPGLPFGGVGASGTGAYHGKHSFETFSHRKAVLKKPTSIDPSLMYPPYTQAKEGWIRRLM